MTDITREAREYAKGLATEVVALRHEVKSLRIKVAGQEVKLARAYAHIKSLEARLCAKRVDEATGFFRKNHRRLLEG